MNKKRIRIIGVLVIAFSLCMPIIVFGIQDFQNNHKKIAWENTSLDKEIMKKYPIISNIYAEFFSSRDYTNIPESYIVRSMDDYTKPEQEKINQIKDLFEREINKLIEYEILSPEMLEITGDYKIEYGTIIDSSDDDGGTYGYSHIYRLNSSHDKSIHFQMNAKSQKITSITYEENNLNYTSADYQRLAYQFVKYLGLEEIDDWTYSQYGYESYKAKLQISFESYQPTHISMGVSLLGSYRPSTYEISY